MAIGQLPSSVGVVPLRSHSAHCCMIHLHDSFVSSFVSFNLAICTSFVLKAVRECRQSLNQMIQRTACNRCMHKELAKKLDKSLRLLDSLCMAKLLLML